MNPEPPAPPRSRAPWRYAWAYPRYAGRPARCWWRFFIPLMAVSSVWPLAALLLFPRHNIIWAMFFAPQGALVVGSIVLLIYRLRVQREVLRYKHPICPECGYAVHDLDSCPECGLAMNPDERRQAWRDANYHVR